MQTDWLKLWHDLAISSYRSRYSEGTVTYKGHHRKVERPDPLLDFVLQNVNSEETVLEIGPGNGRWTIPLAKAAKNVTAVEPSEAMLNILKENISDAKVSNIQILPASWKNASVQPHDVVICAHGIYASPDFAAFVRKMEQYSKKRCYLAIRLPPSDGIIGELCIAIYGHYYDSPNAIIAYNALYSMGIYANVLIEDNVHHWVNSSIEEAFIRAKKHLCVEKSTAYDTLIRETLTRRLIYANDSYGWPDGMRSALLWW
jgi:2-polyprenyl-3-methyl-5-hydroxy-6-metoxy-1,4-benzoquinol methylase